VEDILAIIFIFGGGTAIAVAFSPIGKAIADRIRGRSLQPGAPLEELDEVRGQLQSVQEQLSELAERQDFTERLLAKQKERSALGPAPESH
jgi:hypothetical protein